MNHHIFWELSPLYAGTDDPLLYRDLDQVLESAKSLSRVGPEELRNPEILLNALKKYEDICEKGLRPVLFAELKYFENTGNQQTIALLQKVKEQWGEIYYHTMAFEVSLTKIPKKDLMSLIGHPLLKRYGHYLNRCLEGLSHTLTLQEEQILAQKKFSGREPLIRLYNTILNSLNIPTQTNRYTRVLSVSQVLSALSSGKREEGFHLYTSLLKTISKHGSIWSTILDALVYDNLVEAELRKYYSPIDAQHFVNEIPPVVVKDMLDSVEEFYPLVNKYLSWKAKTLGEQTMEYTDIYARLAPQHSIAPLQAVEAIIDAFERFHPQFGSIAREMFKQRRLHLAPLAQKKTGAFCGCLAPGHSPFVIMSFNGSIGDVLTLAHEMGHAVHYTLAAKQNYLNFMPVPIVSETISTLFELVMVEYLTKKNLWHIGARHILAIWLDNVLKTIFRQNLITRFELALHDMRKKKVLISDSICNAWLHENGKLYGEQVRLPQEFQWGWVHVSHIFERPFYCYSYVFGNLSAILLYERSKGDKTKDSLISFLCSGCSKPPQELFKSLGIEIQDYSIWRQGIEYIEEKFQQLERS